jgi:hypothetical protein
MLKIISLCCTSSLTRSTVAFFPSRDVAYPLLPPYSRVSDAGLWRGEDDGAPFKTAKAETLGAEATATTRAAARRAGRTAETGVARALFFLRSILFLVETDK